MNFKLIAFLFSILCCLIFSCTGYKGGAVKSGMALYEEFFVNDSTLQYYIKPLPFSENLDIDFTFRRVKKHQFSDITMNFTYVSKTIIDEIDMHFTLGDRVVVPSRRENIFREKKKNKFHYRETGIISFEEMQLIFDASSLKTSINSEEGYPSGNTRKKIDKLNSNLFKFKFLD